MMTCMIRMIVICAALAACGGDRGNDSGNPGAAAANGVERTVGSEASEASSFHATVSGAIDRTLEGNGALAGSKYGRYHINMASRERQGGQPVVVIAFGRTDTNTPALGTYALGSGDGFRGTVEVYGDPQREFQITSGELEITGADGDVLTGRFFFSASERTEEYSSQPAEIRAEGTFRTRPAE
ncbi:MAG: hypothetical protein H0X65_00220 [Gemmatimonadetes bacterium]|nr:hypothetical protein [Gemmatimonadota bacterium]